MATFIDALNELSRPSGSGAEATPLPIVLILDTCEEIARTRNRGHARNLDETMRILRALHDGPATLTDRPKPGSGLPNLRVIFAGRLPLARAGANYRDPTTDLPPRNFLRLHELRGFTDTEARTYLLEKRRVPANYLNAILERTKGKGGRARLVAVEAAEATTIRWHPYDLKDFADWVLDDNPPTLEVVREAKDDRFLEHRILRRVPDGPLKKAIPILAALGHFDLEALEAACEPEAKTDPGDRRASLTEALQGLSWIDRREATVNEGRATRHRLELGAAQVRGRMRRFFGIEAATLPGFVRVAERLRRQTLEEDLGALDWSVIDAAWSILGHDPAQGVAWWDQLVHRFLVQRGPAWTADLLRLLTEDDAADQSDGPSSAEVRLMRIAILDTYLICERRAGRTDSRLETWNEEVFAGSRALPEPWAMNVRLRSVATRIILRRSTRSNLGAGLLTTLWNGAAETRPEDLHPLTASVLREALAAIVNEVEDQAGSDLSSARRLLGLEGGDRSSFELEKYGPGRLVSLLNRAYFRWRDDGVLSDEAIDELTALFLWLQGWLLRVLGLPREARAILRDACGAVSILPPDRSRAEWSYLGLPDDVPAYVLLRCGEALYPELDAADTMMRTLSTAQDVNLSTEEASTTSREGDQLQSLWMRLGLAIGPPDPDLVKFLATAPRGASPDWLALYQAGGRCEEPPTPAAAAAVLAAAGLIQPSLDLLASFRSESKLPAEILRYGDREAARVHRRMRLADAHFFESGDGLITWDDPADYSLVASLTTLWLGARREPFADLLERGAVERRYVWFHEIWRTTPRRGQTDLTVEAANWVRRNMDLLSRPFWGQSPGQSFAVCSARLDLQEIIRLPGIGAGLFGRTSLPEFGVAHVSAWIEAHPLSPVEGLTLLLRALALESPDSPSQPAAHETAEELARHIGLRRAADIAFEEGELLRLRYPAFARSLLDTAHRWFEASGDPVGQLLAGILLALSRGPETAGDPVVVRAPYERVREQLLENLGTAATLPAWSQLKTAVDEGGTEPSAYDRLVIPATWLPWIVRLLTWLHGHDGSGASSRYRQWLYRTLGIQTPEGIRLPADLDGWFPMEDESQYPSPSLAAVAARSEESLGHARKGVSQTLPRADGSASSRVLKVRARDPIATDPNQSFSTGQRRPIFASVGDSGPVAWETPGLEAYEEDEIPAELAARLGVIFDEKAAPPGNRTVVIDADADLHSPCWEAVATRAFSALAEGPGQVQFVRRLPARKQDIVPERPPEEAAILSVVTSETSSVAFDGWGPLTAAKRVAWWTVDYRLGNLHLPHLPPSSTSSVLPSKVVTRESTCSSTAESSTSPVSVLGTPPTYAGGFRRRDSS